MREKFIDSALLIGLVVVCAVIVVTLFFPGARRNRSLTTPPTSLETTQTTQPETAEGVTVPSEGGVPVISSEGQTAAPEAGELQPQTEPEAGAIVEPTPETSAEAATEAATENSSAEPVPEGAFDLERVGFSFAGVMGACSVVLEPWRHVAVSRDILAKYPCGSEVTIDLDEPVAGRSSFRAVVGDTMNPSNVRTVNIYVSPDEPALQYGVAAGRLEP
ncbi:hypothetical protein BH24DEI2_BH24DEI2_13910 [soil metagenome]